MHSNVPMVETKKANEAAPILASSTIQLAENISLAVLMVDPILQQEANKMACKNLEEPTNSSKAVIVSPYH